MGLGVHVRVDAQTDGKRAAKLPRDALEAQTRGDSALLRKVQDMIDPAVQLSLGLDFLYLLLYAAAIALACVRVASRLAVTTPPWSRKAAL